MTANGQLSRRRMALILIVLIGIAGAILWMMRSPERPNETVVRPTAPPLSSEVSRLQEVGQSLRTLQPGVTRTEVEALLGRAAPTDIGAVERVNGQTVFRVRYTAILTEPAPSAPNIRGYCEAELLFDAGRAGHPLLGITFSPKPLPPELVSIAAT